MATPIKFGTDGWRAIIAKDYTYDNLRRVTEALAIWLLERHEKPTVALGYDCRFMGERFSRAVANQLAHRGIRVLMAPNFASTPMVSLATLQRQLHVGVVITASHNPPDYSGFKIKAHYGGPASPATIAEVEALIPDWVDAVPDQFDQFVEQKLIEYYDMEALYINHVRQSIDLDLINRAGVKLGFDAMYGAGQRAMRTLFPKATLLHCEFNPSFMGQAPEPIERNLRPFQELIKAQGLQFGLATDGDADRIGLFDQHAQFVDSHHIMLLLIHYLHKYKGMGGKVVVTFSCTDRIQKLCELYGLPVEVTKIGFKYIAEIMTLEDVLVGGEESGGIAVKGHVPERDGIYIGLIILEMMARTGKTLTELVEEVYAVTGPFAFDRNDLHLTEAQKQAILARCAGEGFAAFGSHAIQSTETIDGFKYRFAPGEWVLVRPSGTEPVLRVYAEAATPARAGELLAAALETLLAVG